MPRSFMALQQQITDASLKQGKAAGINVGIKYCEEWKQEYAEAVKKMEMSKREIDAKKGKIPVADYNKLVSEQNKKTSEVAKMKSDLEMSMTAMQKLIAQTK